MAAPGRDFECSRGHRDVVVRRLFTHGSFFLVHSCRPPGTLTGTRQVSDGATLPSFSFAAAVRALSLSSAEFSAWVLCHWAVAVCSSVRLHRLAKVAGSRECSSQQPRCLIGRPQRCPLYNEDAVSDRPPLCIPATAEARLEQGAAR